MKTRFDYSGVWITGVGEAVPVGNMETPHLLNTVRMLCLLYTSQKAL